MEFIFLPIYLCLQCISDDLAEIADLMVPEVRTSQWKECRLKHRGERETLDSLIQEKMSVIIQDCCFQTRRFCVCAGGTRKARRVGLTLVGWRMLPFPSGLGGLAHEWGAEALTGPSIPST